MGAQSHVMRSPTFPRKTTQDPYEHPLVEPQLEHL